MLLEQAQVELVHVKLDGWDTDLHLKFVPRDMREPVVVYVAAVEWWYEPETGWWGDAYEVQGCTRAPDEPHSEAYLCRNQRAWWPQCDEPTGPPDLQVSAKMEVVYGVIEGAKKFFHLKLVPGNIGEPTTVVVVDFKRWYQPETGWWGDLHEVQGLSRATIARQQR